MHPAALKSHFRKLMAPALLLAMAAGLAEREFTAWRRGAAPEMAAWSNIGGCGSSGGGAAAGAGKWIGRGVSGGLVDMEILSNKTLGGDYLYSSVGSTTTFHVPSLPTWTASLALGWKSNLLEYEGAKAAEDLTSRMDRVVGGFGDLGLSLNRLFGNENEHSASLSLSLPTGQHNHKRLHFKGQNIERDDVRYLNPFVQPGSGLYNLGAGYEWTKTKDWGLLVFGGSYTSAWAWDNWGCRDKLPGGANDKLYSCQTASPSPLTWKLWELEHQHFGWEDDKAPDWLNSYGAPGTGATGADGISLYGYVGRKEEASTQNVGLTLSIPMAPTYYWEYGPPGPDDNRVSTRIRTNDYVLKFSAGLEITNPDFPIFLSLGVPWALNDILERGRLTDPQNYVGTVGIKGTFF